MKNGLPLFLENKYLRTAVLGITLVGIGGVDSVGKKVDQIVASSDEKNSVENLQFHLQEVRKYFPDNLQGEEFMEKSTVIIDTIESYEDIIQEFDDPARAIGMKMIQEQNIARQLIISEGNQESQKIKLYKKSQLHLAELLLFIKNNSPQESNQCRNPNITV